MVIPIYLMNKLELLMPYIIVVLVVLVTMTAVVNGRRLNFLILKDIFI